MIVGCKCGNTNYKSEYDKSMDQWYTYAECKEHKYYWEGYTNSSFEKKPLINEQGEVDKEYDMYFERVQNCKSKEEIEIEFGLHWARLNLIHKKYRQHETEIKKNGIDIGRGLSV